jgi:catechol 2,3-dioxygenase-like lactoylglutathione lyase family enzyme
MLRRVDRVILRVASLPGAVSYYRDVLGLILVRDDGRVASFKLAEGDTELIVHADPELPAEAVYYLVDSVRDLYERRAALKLRFSGPPIAATHGYRAEVKDPFGNVLRLLDRTTDQSAGAKGAAAIEDGRSAGSLFAGVEPAVPARRTALIGVYEQLGRTADDLPYTPHFETLYSNYCAHYPDIKPSRQEVWRHLLNLRKAGKLPRLGEARSAAPEISDEEKKQLRDLLGDQIGKRDRLPYTPRFESLVNEFNRHRTRPISPHLVWRLVATLAK